MPQVRKRRPKLGTLCVRPWQHKRRKPSASQQPRKAGSETGEAVRVPSATEPNGTPKGSTTGAEDDPAALDLQNAKAPVQPTSHKFFRSRSGGGSIEGRSVDREGLSSLLVSGAGTCSGTTLSVEGLASVAWVGTLGTFSGHIIEPASRTCFGLHGRGVSQVAECTKDEDKQLLLMVITDYRGYDVSLPVERSGGDVARLRTAEGDLLIDEEKETSCQLCRTVEVEFQCDVMKTGSEAERYAAKCLPAALSGRDIVINKGTMKLSGLPFPPIE